MKRWAKNEWDKQKNNSQHAGLNSTTSLNSLRYAPITQIVSRAKKHLFVDSKWHILKKRHMPRSYFQDTTQH